MSHFCECCENNNQWVEQHIDPSGTLKTVPKNKCFEKSETFRNYLAEFKGDKLLDAIEDYIRENGTGAGRGYCEKEQF